MKAKEVLRRYAAGQRDFRRVNLRGQSFQGKDLSGADFSEADIRGAKFTNTNLREAKICGAKGGLEPQWLILLVTILFLLSALIGLVSGSSSIFVPSTLAPEFVEPAVMVLLLLAVSSIVNIRYGFLAFLVATAVVLTMSAVLAVTLAMLGNLRGAVVLAMSVPSTMIVTVTAGANVAAAITVAGDGAAIVMGIIAVAATVAGAETATMIATVPETKAGIVALVVNIAAIGLGAIQGAYMAKRVLGEDQKFALIRPIAIAFAAIGGTSFRGANLINADFTGAILKSTDFRKAILTRTCWYKAKKIDRARVGDTILADPVVRELLVTGNAYEKSYAGAKLRGANLIKANLTYANLKEADISQATFNGACLEWANLTETNAVGADFTGASLTGACLEAWNTESSTKLKDVDCRFVYLLENPEPRTDNRERRPSSGEFQPGEFTK
ncbi:MAG: pentapeptide repeat-containing protein, partial [Moorea sp. SIO3I7]|nr:pentapeptide repeat-containing protein [Moorena sp. SIO3I7]